MIMMIRFFALTIICILNSTALAHEFRVGFVKPPQEYEKCVGGNIEYIIPEKFTRLDLKPHIGVNINKGGYTNSLHWNVIQ